METLRLALSSIVEHRMRAFLTTLGVVFGVMAVIAVTAIVQGFFRLYSAQLEGLGAGFLLVFPGNAAAESARKITRLTAGDASAVEGVDDVLAASPYFFDRRTVTLRGQNAEAVVMPTLETYPLIQNHHVAEGRFFTAREVRERARVVVLGPDLAEQLGLVRAVGEEVRLYGVPFTVIGVMEEKDGMNALGQNFDDAAVVPYPTALSMTNPNRGGLLLVKLKEIDDVELATEQVRRALRRFRRLRPGEPDDFTTTTQAELLKSFEEISGVATWVVVCIVGVSLLVGGIGIMNIMLVSVTERTREIGVRLAMGARKGDIQRQFLLEAAALGGLGGLLGIAAGVGVAHLVSAVVPNFPAPFVPLWSVLLAFGFAVGVGLVFGIYPAARAARLDPIEALRYE
ncbi:MAG: FtsX-like permease family protein [Deltaproteobacteria bacterium]|nr:FtsX-like permease family protein [Deltaproteobacteria bacterium]